MRELQASTVTEAVARLCMAANYDLGSDVEQALERAVQREESEGGRVILQQILENARIARTDEVAICQDCGLAVVFLDLGQEVHVVGGDLYEAVDEGVRRGYKDGYLRKSSARQPFSARVNTGDNTPAIIHTRIVPGEQLHITVAPKGGGSENMSRVAMLTPAAGRKGVADFVVKTVDEAGANPCPPIIVGVGVGGTFERVTYLAKHALLREIGTPNPDPELDELEHELLERINKLGIGPQGFGGRVTALAVHIEAAPCHIASMPAAVNIQCHAARHKEIIL
jgi:fumarate hydratase subunit alpha